MKSLVCVLFLTVLASHASGQVQIGDSCYALWPKGYQGEVSNPDSVLLDTCHNNTVYAKKKFSLTFLYQVLQDSISSSGDTMDRDWRAIDTSYSNVRDGMAALEQKFGIFKLHHIEIVGFDSSSPFTKEWDINFESYVNVDSAEHDVLNLPGQDTNWYRGFHGWPHMQARVRQSDGRRSGCGLYVYPNPVSSSTLIFLDEWATGEAFFVEIVDAKGNHVVTIKEAVAEAEHRICYRLDCSNLVQGTYFVRVSNSTIGKMMKFVKE